MTLQIDRPKRSDLSGTRRRAAWGMMCWAIVAGLCASGLFAMGSVRAQEAVSLISANDAAKTWSFNNGSEFPGATGSLAVDSSAEREGRTTLKLIGDFTKGGGYVQAGRKLDNLDIRDISFWVRAPGTNQFTLRLGDSSGQTHQIVLKIETSDDWQQVVLPLEKFFARRGEADAVTSIAKYESWGGAKDGRWHGPATAIYLLLGKRGENIVRTLYLNDLTIVTKPTPVPGADVVTSMRLDEVLESTHDWRFSRGEEFRGAKGDLTVAKDTPAAGQTSLKLEGNFTGGGAYVAAIKSFSELDAKSIPAIRLKVKSDNATSISVQMVDSSGQTHQRKGVKIIADGQWHDLVIKPEEIAGGEHWGGANDAKWHPPGRQLALSLTQQSDAKMKQPVVYLHDIRADVVQPVFVQPAAFKADFENKLLSKNWKLAEGVSVDSTTAFKGNNSLLLERGVNDTQKGCYATCPAFSVSAGLWEIHLATKAKLHSPDNSYNTSVHLECLDSAGKVVERIELTEVFGEHDWKAVKKRVELPQGVASARIHTQLNKTYGRFYIDELAASYLAPAPRRDDRIARMLFSTSALGNLLFPNDSREVGVTVETRKPLRDSQRTITFVVKDYWGAEHTKTGTATLGSPEKKGDRFVYATSIDLSQAPLELGRYYELHADIPQEGESSFHNYTSLAILPEAITRQFKPEEVPFTSRNWDNRITEFIKLTDRLGPRICGVWGGWSSKPPYKPEAPSLDLVHKLGMGWLTTTPAKTIEDGKKDYDETALRQGARNFLEKFGHIRPLIINLGNEPHGKGERVLNNVAAYRVIYEEVKKFDSTIPVVATSVEPNEEYFKAGYGKWCDAYDFHIYEDSANVRRTINEYNALAKKYDVPRPIWSTELGLNSQGMTRQVVAAELIKKFSTFFAAGGTNVSWFGLLYPDADGKQHGSSTNSHNVFDCRYNRYAPRLDAIAYYNAVNGIAIKKFVVEKQYAGGVSAFLFRDRDLRTLQVLWKEKGTVDVHVPLKGVQEVQLIRIDGTRSTLQAAGDGVSLTISADPVLLLYNGGAAELHESLGTPRVAWHSLPNSLVRNEPFAVDIVLNDAAEDDIDFVAPPFWEVTKGIPKNAGDAKPIVRFTLQPPATTSVREVQMLVTIKDSRGNRQGELLQHRRFAE